MMEWDEKRSTKRVAVQLVVSGRAKDGTSFEEIGQTRDVSAGGVYFYTARELAPGAPLELMMPLPEEIAHRAGVWVLCHGEVARIEPLAAVDGRNGIGVKIQSYEIMPEA